MCLSGGGYRAALFHLGAVERLNELGALGHVSTVSSASGGSILNAHLADALDPWPAPGERCLDFDERVIAPMLDLTRRDVRTWSYFSRALPPNWRTHDNTVRQLDVALRRHLTGRTWGSLASGPRHVFCATDMVFGAAWVWDTHSPLGIDGGWERRPRTGDPAVGYRALEPTEPISTAVAASSCSPPMFSPMLGHLDPAQFSGGHFHGDRRDELVAAMSWSDGGLYDNLALEPVWTTHETLLVSDASAVFKMVAPRGPIRRLLRYVNVAANGGADSRKRMLMELDDTIVAYWGLDTDLRRVPGGVERLAYDRAFIHDVIESVRTDLDGFSDAEQGVLRNHGYLLADATVRRFASHLVDPAVGPPDRLPCPDWADPVVAERALAGTHERKVFGHHPRR